MHECRTLTDLLITVSTFPFLVDQLDQERTFSTASLSTDPGAYCSTGSFLMLGTVTAGEE